MNPSNEGKVAATRLINDLGEISFTSIALIIVATWLGILLARSLLPRLARRVPSRLRLYLLGAVPVIRLTLLALAFLSLVPIIFNVTLQNFLVIAGAAGVALGFAFKDLLSSVVAGVVAVFERPYRPGDWVKIDGDYGEVIAVGMRAIRIRTPADDVITVPHDKLWQNNIANANDGSHTLMCVTSFHLAPEHDAARIRAVLRDIALTSAYLEYEKPVLVVVDETQWGTRYRLKAYPFDMRDQFQFISDLTVRGKAAIRRAGGREIAAAVAVTTGDRQAGPDAR